MLTDAARWSSRLRNTVEMAARAQVERRVPFWPAARVERVQRRRLRRIVGHGYATVPYYRQAMDERGLRPADIRTAADLAKLPLLDGETARRDPERFASTRYDDGSRHAEYSSGALTHVRRLVYWDDAALLRGLVHGVRDRAVLAPLVGQSWGQRQLSLFTRGGDNERLRAYWSAQTLGSGRLADRLFLSPSLPYDEIAARIVEFRPHVVFSIGSFAEHFSRYLVAHGRSLAGPRVWVFGGDMLPPAGRELVERTVGCPVYSTYQTTETGKLGFECERRTGFHLNVDLCAVRIVDEAGRDVPRGEVGEIVVSNLYNRATVLLNYRLGDRGALAIAPCPCGRSLPLLERFEGRSSDVIALADGRTMTTLQIDAAFEPVLRTALKAQVVQPAPGHLRWRVVPFPDADRETLRRGLMQRGRDFVGEDTRLEVEYVADIPPTPSGKFPRVVTSGANHV